MNAMEHIAKPLEKTIMKLKLIPLAFAMVAMAHAAPEGIATGIPSIIDLDADGDGIISEAERQAFIELRRAASQGGASVWDTDGDGVISPEERKEAAAALRARAEERRAALFAKAAGDDGLLSKEEFAALPALANVPQATIDLLFALFDIEEGEDGVTMEAFLAAVRGGGIKPIAPPTFPKPPFGRE